MEFILGLCEYVLIMEKKIETTIMGYIVYRILGYMGMSLSVRA